MNRRKYGQLRLFSVVLMTQLLSKERCALNFVQFTVIHLLYKNGKHSYLITLKMGNFNPRKFSNISLGLSPYWFQFNWLRTAQGCPFYVNKPL